MVYQHPVLPLPPAPSGACLVQAPTVEAFDLLRVFLMLGRRARLSVLRNFPDLLTNVPPTLSPAWRRLSRVLTRLRGR